MARRGKGRVNTFMIDSGVAPLGRRGEPCHRGMFYKNIGKRARDVQAYLKKHGMKVGVIAETIGGEQGEITSIDKTGNARLKGHPHSYNCTSLTVVAIVDGLQKKQKNNL